MKNWSFSIVLLLVYLGTFHLWMFIGPSAVLTSGLAIAAVLSIALLCVQKHRYFRNKFDLFWHSTVILDIFLEAILIPEHDHYGFYLCALGFTIVIGRYRAYVSGTMLRREQCSRPT